MTRKELRYAGYRAIAVDAYREGHVETNLYPIYLGKLRGSPYCKADNGTALGVPRLDLQNGGCKPERHVCQLFATDGGEGIYIPPSSSGALPASRCVRYNDSTRYSIILVTDGCERMDKCIAQLENEGGLKETAACFGYDDDEIRWLIRSHFP